MANEEEFLSEEKKLEIQNNSKKRLEEINSMLKNNKDLTQEQRDELETESVKLAGFLFSGKVSTKKQIVRLNIAVYVFIIIVVLAILYFLFW